MSVIQSRQRKSGDVLAYCPICNRTLRIPLDQHSNNSSTGGLTRHTYVHEKPEGGVLHALVLMIDENGAVRRAEITDMCLETGTCQCDFKVTTYCYECQRNLEIPIGIQEFESSLEKKGFYKQSYIHGGKSPHTLLILVDKERIVRRAETTSMHLVSSLELTPNELPKEEGYTVLETYMRSEFSYIFAGLLIFDRRSKVVSGFFTKYEYDISKIAEQMEEHLNKAPEVLVSAPSFQFNGNECIFMTNKAQSHCIVGINFSWRSYFQWLTPVIRQLSKEEETPNSLGIEVYIRIIKSIGRQSPKDRLPKDQVLYDLLFSPLYASRFTFKYQKTFERVLDRLANQFPNTYELFRHCASGEKSILEVLSTEKGIQHYEEFIKLINFVERRKLF